MFTEKALLEHILPNTSFVEFEAFRPIGMRIGWLRDGIDEVDAGSNFYCLPTNQDAQCDFMGIKHFLAERYGGEGLGANGGGSRCGMRDGIQIKGIGRNPLAGTTTDFFHSYGGMGAFEGLLEVIWGTVCDSVLPYGGSDPSAFAILNERVPLRYPRTKGPRTEPRALVSRRPVLRPAHYMRSVYYRALPNKNVDANRTQNAIAALLLHIGGDVQPQRALWSFLADVIRRFAKQLAAARAKRLMHGSLTASNVGVWGEWIDYASMSMLSDYGPLILPRGAPSFFEEEKLFLRTIESLAFYLSKYGLGIRAVSTPFPEMFSFFWGEFERELEREFLLLVGATERQLTLMPKELRQQLFTLLRRLILLGNSEPFMILSQDNDARPVMPDKMGAVHIPQLLRKIARAPDSHVRRLVAEAVGSIDLAVDFSDCYVDFRRLCIKTCSSGMSFGWCVFVARCLCKTSTFPELYRTNLHPALENFVQTNMVDAAGLVSSKTKRIVNLLKREGLPINLVDEFGVNAVLHNEELTVPEKGQLACPDSLRQQLCNLDLSILGAA